MLALQDSALFYGLRCQNGCAYRDETVSRRKNEEAAEMLFRNNPFSAITSIVCDWKRIVLDIAYSMPRTYLSDGMR